MSSIKSFGRPHPLHTAAVAGTPAHRAVFLDEKFATKNEVDWDWSRIKGAAGYSLCRGVQLFTNAGASDKVYADAEIHTRRTYLRKNAEMVVSSPTIDKGSRGWGFWNHSFDPQKAEIAGFIALQGGPDYPYNGLYAFTQHGGAGPRLRKLDERYLASPRTYSIEWVGNSISYKIDGVEVDRVTGNIPTEALGLYLWDDNAIWDFDKLQPILQNVATKAPLNVHSVRITE